MKCPTLASLFLLAWVLASCGSGFGVSHVEIADPDAGIIGAVEVQPDGMFEGKIESGDTRVIVSGKITSQADEKFAVTLAFERRVYTEPSMYRSQKLDTEFVSLASVVVPIGKSPVPEAGGEDNELENLTIRLRPNADCCP